jgi:hypothetical protein
VLQRDEALTVLQEIVSSAAGNINPIETWTGQFSDTIRSRRTGEGLVEIIEQTENAQVAWLHTKLQGSFSIDLKGDRMFIECRQLQARLDDNTGQSVKLNPSVRLGPVLKRQVLTPASYLELDDIGTNERGEPVNSVTIRPIAEARKRAGWTHDPRRLIDASGPHRVWDFLKRLREEWPHLYLADPQDPSQVGRPTLVYWVEEIQSKPHRSYRLLVGSPLQQDGQRPSLQEHVFDGSLGFNRTYFVERMGGKRHIEFEFMFTKKNQSYLPEEATHKRYSLDTGELAYERTISLTDQYINITIAGETFTFPSLGLREGERIHDRANNQEFKLRGGNWIPIPKSIKESD